MIRDALISCALLWCLCFIHSVTGGLFAAFTIATDYDDSCES